MLFSRPGEPLCSSEEPTLPSGSFFQVLLAELAGFITGKKGRNGICRRLAPACLLVFSKTFSTDLPPDSFPSAHPVETSSRRLRSRLAVGTGRSCSEESPGGGCGNGPIYWPRTRPGAQGAPNHVKIKIVHLRQDKNPPFPTSPMISVGFWKLGRAEEHLQCRDKK